MLKGRGFPEMENPILSYKYYNRSKCQPEKLPAGSLPIGKYTCQLT